VLSRANLPSFPTSPIVGHKALLSGLSEARVCAYSSKLDSDSIDAVARYLWNIALGNAIWPAVHVLEVVVRNALYEEGVSQTSRMALTYRKVDCWLDAGILEKNEEEDVQRAKERLSVGRLTPGHLVSELTFGFWVRLCNRPYEQGKGGRPRLWPGAVRRFYRCPRTIRNREDIGRALANLADFRNRIAHHHPIWDRRPDKRFLEIVDAIEWTNPSLAAAVKYASELPRIYDAGPKSFREMGQAMVAVAIKHS
jgi:hypothetical protein